MEAVFGTLWVPCLILSVIGVALLITELFLPGFGVAGLTGVACLIAVSIMQFVCNNALTATLVTVVLGAIVVVMVLVFMRSMKKGLLFRSPIVLKDKIEAEAVQPSAGVPADLVGKTGTALTPLRPSGTAEIEGKRYSVVTDATFVDAGAGITVVSVDGSKITVK